MSSCRDVDETTREVAGVRGAQRRVGKTLSRAVGRDEVLEHREPLTERGDDRARDHLTARVRDEALHAGDLAHLLGVPTGAGVDHHVERVELDRGERLLHRPTDLGVRRGPDLDLLLAPLVVGDDAALELRLGLFRFLFVAVQDRGLLGRRLHVVDRDRQPGLRRVEEAELLDLVQALGDDGLVVVRRELLDDRADRGRTLADDVIHEAEVSRQRRVEEQSSRRRLDLGRQLRLIAIVCRAFLDDEGETVCPRAEADLRVQRDVPRS